MDIKQYMTQLGQRARQASRELARADSNKKNKLVPLKFFADKNLYQTNYINTSFHPIQLYL